VNDETGVLMRKAIMTLTPDVRRNTERAPVFWWLRARTRMPLLSSGGILLHLDFYRGFHRPKQRFGTVVPFLVTFDTNQCFVNVQDCIGSTIDALCHHLAFLTCHLIPCWANNPYYLSCDAGSSSHAEISAFSPRSMGWPGGLL